MQPVPTRSRSFAVLVAVPVCAVAIAIVSAQQNTVVPQPVASTLPAPGTASPKPSRPAPKPEGVSPSVPAGFTVSTYAELPSPRMMAYAPNGDLFVSSPGTNTITVLRDANNDGTFEARGTFTQGGAAPPRGGGGGGGGAAAGGRRAGGPPPGFGTPPSVLGASAPACTPPPEFVKREPGTLAAPFGLAFHDGYLYVGNTGSLVRYKYTNGDLQAQGEPEKLMDLPSGGHSTRNIVFNRAGTKMYIAVGSQSNNDAGEDCRRAAVLEFNPDGSGYRVYASGIRNPVGLALQPGTDIVWTAINERDNLGDDLVPDYATSVKEGGFYGWPYLVHRQELRPALRRRVSRAGQQDDRSGRPDPVALGRPRHHLLYRHTVPSALSQRRLRRAARIVEPIGGVRLQGGVLPDEQRTPGTDRRFPHRLPGQRWFERHTDRAVGPSRRRHRRARWRVARLG